MTLLPDPDNTLSWKVIFDGPIGSQYEGAQYLIQLQFPSNYPFKPPSVQFITKVWNPSITEKGEICLDLLQNWKPMIQVPQLLVALQSLLQEPSADGALNSEAAEQLKKDPEGFWKKVAQWRELYGVQQTTKN